VPDWELREATKNDREFLFRLHCAAIRDSVEALWGWDEGSSAGCSTSGLPKRLGFPVTKRTPERLFMRAEPTSEGGVSG
jgi:hypothetical protein